MNVIFSINHDTFIYSVNQAFNARNDAKSGFNSHLQYPPFLESTWKKPKNIDIESLKKPLISIIRHHFKAIPHYKRKEAVNLENISWFAQSTACLYSDISFLLQEVLSIVFSIDNESSSEVLSLIKTTMNQVFKDYSTLLYSYLEWKSQPKDTETTKVDWNVRPPCGLLYRTEFKALFDEIRQAKFGKKPFSNKNKSENSANKHGQNSKPQSSKHDRPSNTDSRQKRGYQKPDRREEHKVSAEQLQSALNECEKALENIKNNSKIHEIPLSAQNSFVRRKQHALITEAGFFTDSRGEAALRHVCILRENTPRSPN